MALFPRKVNGQYAMLSRQDDENLLIMFSDNVRFWQTPKLLLAPEQPWEFFKIGNCGSPIETEAGGRAGPEPRGGRAAVAEFFVTPWSRATTFHFPSVECPAL